PAIQQLNAGQSLTDSFTAVSSDGTASRVVTVTIHGTNDVPVIGGVSTGDVTEAVNIIAGNNFTTEALTIADLDAGQSNLPAQASPPVSILLGPSPPALYALSLHDALPILPAIQQLNAGQSLTDSFTAVSSDGTASRVVTVTIHGTNDVPVIGGVSTGDVTEDVNIVAGNIFTSGALTIADVDAGQSNFTAQASTPGSNGFGTFTLAANGACTNTATDTQPANHQPLPAQPPPRSSAAVSSDGTASRVVTVTIHGTNDVPVIGGVSTGDVTEDVNVVAGNIFTSGALTIADVDAGQSNFTDRTSVVYRNAVGTTVLA